MITKTGNAWDCGESYTLEAKSVITLGIDTLINLVNIKKSIIYALLNIYARDG